MTQVYWIYNKYCLDPSLHGYVGVSISAEMRFSQHKKKTKRFPPDKSRALFCKALSLIIFPIFLFIITNNFFNKKR